MDEFNQSPAVMHDKSPGTLAGAVLAYTSMIFSDEPQTGLTSQYFS